MKKKKKKKKKTTTACAPLVDTQQLLPLRRDPRRIRELGVGLNTDASKLNNATALLSVLLARSTPTPPKKDDDDDDDVVDLAKGVAARKEARKGEEEEEEQRRKVESILALEKFFAARVARGDVERAKRDATESKRETTTSKKDESMTQSVVDEDAIVEQKKRKYRA